MIKRIFIFLLACFSNSISYSQISQPWFDVGIKGGYGPTVIYNSEYSDNSRLVNYQIKSAPTFGGRLGFNFNEKHSVNLEVISSRFTQSFSVFKDSAVGRVAESVSFSALEVPVLYKSSSGSGYFEVGPVVSFPAGVSSSSGRALSFSNVLYSGLFGFGSNVIGTDKVTFTLGARFTVGVNDLFGDESLVQNQVIDPVSYSFLSSSGRSLSRLVTARAIAELSYDIGYFAKSRCGKKRKFLSF